MRLATWPYAFCVCCTDEAALDLVHTSPVSTGQQRDRCRNWQAIGSRLQALSCQQRQHQRDRRPHRYMLPQSHAQSSFTLSIEASVAPGPARVLVHTDKSTLVCCRCGSAGPQ